MEAPKGMQSSAGRSESESAVARIWCEVLRVPQVERDANFFDIGGDSMKAMEVIARVGEVLQVDLPLLAFFEDPSVAHLAAVIDELRPAGVATMVRVPGRLEFPLSHFQQVFWLLERQHPGTGLYNTARIFRIQGKVDSALLERSLNELCRRHEILRVRFVERAAGPVQVVEPVVVLRIAVSDLSALDPDASQRAALKLMLETVREPFDLACGPVLRARLVRLTSEDCLLSMALHHAVSDGFTGSILLDELGTIYDALAEGRAIPLPESDVHFTDYAVWERAWMDDSRLARELEYWREVLQGAPSALDLPEDRALVSASDRRGRQLSTTISPESLNRLQVFAQANGSTLFSVLAAAVRIVLYRWSGQADFILGTIASNRSVSGTERMLGCFVNPLALRNPIADGQSALDLLNAERDAVMGAFAHQDCPFASIVEDINPERTANDNPLFNVALLLQSFPSIAWTGSSFKAEHFNFDTQVALLDLRFIAAETAGALQLDCEYRANRFESHTIENLLASIASVLQQMVAAPGTRVGKIDISRHLLERGAEHRQSRHKRTIAIAANFTVEPLEEPLVFWMEQLRMPSRIEFAPFDQVYQQLLDPTSLLARNSDGFNIVFVQWRDGQPPEDQGRELAQALKAAAARGAVPFILCVCPPSVQAGEQVLAAELAGQPGIHVVYPADVLKLYPVDDYRDEYAEALGAIPYTPAFFVALASMAARRIHGIQSTPYKAIALDCDNTLWKGVCGEDGPASVEVGAPHRALQEFMLAQRSAGMLLCLASKNAETDVDAVFETNAGMLLQREHFVASRVNWRSKSENLKDLARELGIGVESFILVDDNPLECAEVRANCPAALVLELPSDSLKISAVLRHFWAFDHLNVTEEDRRRSDLYQQGREREALRGDSGDLEKFLRGLDLKVFIRRMETEDLARVSQLTQRTNQFNCNTIRRTEIDVQRACEAGSECLVVEASDRFGDYGLVGMTMFSVEAGALIVDTLLLSCRALGRKVEHHVLAKLGAVALDGGLDWVDVRFVATPKNKPAVDFLDSIGSADRRNGDGVVVYRFSAQNASLADQLKVSELPKPSRETAPTASTPAPPHIDLLRVASELGEVQAISMAIRTRYSRTAIETGVPKARTASEEILAGIWASLLRIEQPGSHDNFFQLGGNSLLGVQVISRVRQTLGVEMPLRTMFEEPTLAGFARQIESAQRSQAGLLRLPPMKRQGRSETVPASFAQQRLWFINQIEPENPIYNIPQMRHIRGPLQVDALEKSLNEIVRRHEALRTTFQVVDGQPMQLIGAPSEEQLFVSDLSYLPDNERNEEIERLALQNAMRPFDLAHDPMLRASLLRTAPDDHVLLIVIHHIAGDRWSAGILAQELAALYAAFVRGEPSPLPELAIQYADFALWQRGWLQGSELELQAAYWRQQLAGAPPLLELPTDRPRPSLLTFRGLTETLVLSRELVRKLTVLSQDEGVTLFMTLLAAYQTLLSRYSGQDDIVVGSPIAGRNYAEVEPLIGFFVNTLALRTDLSGNPRFRELLARVKETTLGAYAHQDIPFEKLVEELQPERSLSYQPIFQVLFALQNADQQALQLLGLSLERLPLHQGTSAFDMSWFATHVADGLQVRVEYNTDLFDGSTIRRMLEHFQNLLEAIVEQPEKQLSELEVLDDQERHRILNEFNNTAADYPHGFCIHDLVASQAYRTADAIAVVDGERRISYRELNARANQLAHYLIRHGAGPDVPIGICGTRTADLLTGMLGILKSGSAYVPLDRNYPSERLRNILEDAKTPLVLTLGQPTVLPGFRGAAISLDAVWPEISREPDTSPIAAVRPEHLGYVLFTSGSTGRSKGVAIEHRSAATFIQWAKQVFSASELEGVLFSTSVCFDLSVFEIFVTLSSGGKVILAENALYLPTLSARNEVTLINTVPSAMAELVRMGGVPASVKTVNLAGEALSNELVEQIYATATVEKVNNLYGPTEDTTYSTYTLVPRGVPVTIGKPIANTRAYILDSHGKIAPIGVRGELFLAGEGLARGYYGRPDLTAERFVPNPFSVSPTARMYRTGDRCRWLPTGDLQYLGRLDYQIKLRGFRIELGEIEATLDRCDGVERSIVSVRGDGPGIDRLVAYVVPRPGATLSPAALEESVRATLPDFMIPSAFVLLDEFPLTPNGKIDRKALPAPTYQQESEKYLAPRTTTELRLAEIWSALLHRPHIGVRDNFFALGGHSLLAAQVISRVRLAMNVDLPLRSIFERPTLDALAARIDVTAQSVSLAPIPAQPRDKPLPLSSAQDRLWFLDQLEPENSQFNVPMSMRLTGLLDSGCISSAVNAIIRRHEILRTTYRLHNDRPVQVIAPELTIDIPVVDISHIPAEQRQAEARRLVIAEGQRPFRLETGPLIRGFLFRLDERDHILLLNIHHSATDGWSMGPLVRELATLYEAFLEGRPSTLADLPIQYADYAVWQRAWLDSGALVHQLYYWKKQLADAPARVEMPTDRPRPATQSYRGGTETVTYPIELLNRLQALAGSEETTLYMTLLAAFQLMLHRYTGQNNIVVGTAVANRTRAEVEDLIGVFINTVPMHTDLAGNPSFRELLQRVRTMALGAFSNQELPFEELVKAIAPDRDLSSNPLVQVLFVLQNVQRPVVHCAGVEFKGITIHNQTSKFDFSMFVIERPEGLECMLEYSTDLFDAGTMRRLLGHYGVLLEAITENADGHISELPLLTSEERQQILFDWNATAREYPRELCVQQMFERQAERVPERMAVACGARSLTYAELNGLANQVAHDLRERGTEPGALVGVRMTRGVEMVAALLGILKAGAAYVPLDPDFPAERIAFILEDSGVQLVLTNEDWQRFEARARDNPDTRVNSECLAYVLHTSGSTGRPKGVQITHGNLTNFLTSMQREPGLAESDRLLAVTTLSFDIAGLELYLPLVTGASVLIATAEEAADGSSLLALLLRYRPTVLQATPATWRMLIEAGWGGSLDLKALCGGEALPADLAAQLIPRCGQLWNMYGPTETTIWSSLCRLESAPAGIAPLGRPIANTTMYVLDSRLQPVPFGVRGDLYIGGHGVAQGYLNRPELTSESFLTDPFVPGSSIYRTGDIARILANGELHYVGRSDFQVKVRGFRIELGEVETVLSGHPAVQACVAAVSAERLIAYIAPSLGVPPANELRAWVRERLPEYMTPAAFVYLDRFPLTPNGKVDRKALPAPDFSGNVGEYVEPRTLLEQVIAGIWAEALNVAEVGSSDNFFDLGGHSISATQVIVRIRAAVGVELSVRSLFETPTVAGLARSVERLKRGEAGPIPPPMTRVRRDRAFPLSFAQQRLWFLDQLVPDNPLYNIFWVARLTGSLSPEGLEAAFNGIVKRHDILRTTYRTDRDLPVQVVHGDTKITLEIRDLSGLPAAEREHEARRIVEKESAKPFHLASDVMFRPMLLKLDERDHVLFVNTHHIACDGWSLGVMESELGACYEAALSGQAPALAELPIQYGDYAVWQRDWLRPEFLERQLAYWRKRLHGAPPVLSLPTDRPRPESQTFRGAVERAPISTALAEGIALLSRKEGVTPFMTMLAAFQCLILYYTQQTDIVLGTDLAGRASVETEGLIGFFVNLMALRTDLSEDPPFRELLGRVRETTLGAYTHQDVPFDKLVEELQPERSPSRNPLVQVLFVHMNTPRGRLPLPGIELTGFPVEVPSKFDLAVFHRDSGAGMAGTWIYNRDLFDAKTISKMAGHFLAVLEAVIADPRLRLDQIRQLLTERERQVRALESQHFQEASLHKLKGIKRRAGTSS
jgi:amino acid adenylation domain-containing protein/FkbH-like protein